MFRVGLTGNVASGKSSVARVWERLGAPVIDADLLARRAVAPGTRGLERVTEAFGPAVIGPDGALDRAALRRIVFADPAARARLESIVHPEVARLRREEEARVAARGADLVVHDIPLLFEAGLQDEVDMVVLVDAPESLRIERLARDRGLGAEEIRDLVAAQMPAAEKRPRAHVVIENTGTLADLEAAAAEAWRKIQERAGRTGAAGAGPAGAAAAGAAAAGAAPAGPAAAGPAAGRIRVDMHVHTRRSFDCLSDPDAVVERALEAGLTRVCITDHDEIEAALELAARYPEHVIPGEEVKTAERVDVIGLFLTEWVPGGLPARETCELIRAQGGLVYVPHPFAGGKGGRGRILPEIEDLVDAVEGFNARIHDEALNRRATEWGRARGLPLGGGSDAHTLREIGRAFVEVPPFEVGPAGFLRALHDGSVHGRESSRLVHIASTLAKLVP